MRVGRPTKESSGAVRLGQVIAARRHAAGLTRSALAARSGVSGNTLMKVEQGQTRDPGILKIAALCRALSVSLDDIVRMAEQKALPQEISMAHGIVSIGYEGRTIESFVSELRDAGVHTVADVRLNAISRKAGFSKTRLHDALAAAGIGYRHLRALGNAKENRQPFWDGRIEEGRRVFRENLHTADATASLRELADLAGEEVVAVLCFESDAEKCHRTVVIDEIAGAGSVPVVTLG